MLNRLKEYLENVSLSPTSWLIGVSGILMTRFFLEAISSPTSSGFLATDASTLVHYYLFFMAFGMALMLFLYVALPSWRKIIPQFTSVAFMGIFIAPIIDFILSGGKGVTMSYLFNSPKEMFTSFLLFFGPLLDHGITLGIRVEVFIILIAIGMVIHFAEKNLFRTIVSVISLYIIIFIFLSLPGIISVLFGGNHANANYSKNPLTFFGQSIQQSETISNNIHGSLGYQSVGRLFEISFNFMMSKILFVILLGLSLIWFYLTNRSKFKIIFENSRLERVAHYMFMIGLGILTAVSLFPSISINWNDWLSLLMLATSFYFSWMFAVCINDIFDIDIDEVTNTERPLVKNKVSKEDMKQASVIFLTASLLSGFIAGYTTFFFVLVFTSLYYIYSAPPTRFKLIPFFSSFLIGLCCLVSVLAGFFIFSPVKNLSVFPVSLMVGVVIVFFLWSHIRDMKDIEGDKRAGIHTVPIIFGDFWGSKVVGGLSSLAFVLVPFFGSIYLLFISAIPAAVANYYFVNKKPYKEKPIFKTYFFFLIASFLLLLL